MSTDRITLVLGGASSGKSQWAEEFIRERKGTVYYLATARPEGEEMADRISRHRRRRPDSWHTLEPPHQLVERHQQLDDRRTMVLLDGLGLHLARRMEQEPDPDGLLEDLERTWQTIAGGRSRWIVVSSLVGRGLVPNTDSGRRFRRLVGRANQNLARRAHRVVEVVAGLARPLKGIV